MPLPYRIEFERPTLREVRRALRRRGVWVAVAAGILGAGLAATAVRIEFQQARAARGAVAISSSPAGAAVSVDGRPTGRTPLTIVVSPGQHQVDVGGGAFAEDRFSVRVVTQATASRAATLWRANPAGREVRAPLPGARIERAGFLRDGRLWLSIALPPGDAHQLWRFDERGFPEAVGPASLPGPIALSPDGEHLAYPLAAPTDGSRGIPSMVVASTAGDRPAHRYPMAPGVGPITDLAWAPDSRHLLVVTARDDGGAGRSALSRLDAEDGALRPLAELPGDVVPGSEVWRPDGGALAFVAHSADGSALCLLDLASGDVRSLADLRGSAAPPFAPFAWSPDGHESVYSAAVPATPDDLGGLIAGRSSLTTLFLLPGGDALGQRLIPAAGDSPVWRGDGTILAVGAGSGHGPALTAIDPAERRTWPAGTLAVPGSGPLAIAWDVAHARALAARSDAFGARTYLLLSFSP